MSAPLPISFRESFSSLRTIDLVALCFRFTEQLSELYFLQAGGNMMDYAAWRKRPAAPALLAFLEARRPPPLAPPPPDPPPAAAAAAAADEVVEKAKQEAYVARRVAELARAGLWAERRLPRVMEPPRPKTHWDYLLEEMAWLAQDFAHERKWKKQAAKKVLGRFFLILYIHRFRKSHAVPLGLQIRYRCRHFLAGVQFKLCPQLFTTII